MKLINKLKIIYYNICFTCKIHIKWLPIKNALIENLIMPVLSALFYVMVADYISNDDILFYISGAICFTAVDASIGGVSMLISSERRFGTLYAVVGSVFHPMYLFIGRIVYWCVIGYVRFVAVFLTLFLMFMPEKMTVLLWLQCSLIYIFICVSLSGVGYFVGIIGLKKRSIMGISNIIYNLLLLFSEVYFSKELLLPGIRELCYLSPLYYGVKVCRNTIVYNRYEGILFYLLVMLLIGVLYIIAGNIYYHYIQKQILVENQLDMY